MKNYSQQSAELRRLLNLPDVIDDTSPAASTPQCHRIISPSKLQCLANALGRCFLNGEPARLNVGPRARIVSNRDSASFNWTVAEAVIIHKGGRFETR